MRARKFTDRDVREQENLLGVANNYARNYTGEFQFMVDAQKLVIENGTLPVQVARGVLNCMLADPRVFDLPAVKKREPAPSNVIDITTKQPQERRNKPTIEMPVNVKAPFFTARNAEVFHRLSSARVRWVLENYTEEGIRAKRADRRATFQVRPICKTSGYHWYEKVTLHKKVSKGDRLCRTGCWTAYCIHCEVHTVADDITDITYDGLLRCRCCRKKTGLWVN